MNVDPIEEDIVPARTSVSLVCIGDSSEALLLRSILESLGVMVRFHPIGTPGEFMAMMRGRVDVARYLVISAHGNDDGLVFGDYADFIDTSVLKDGSLPGEALVGTVDLPGSVVISTACNTARPEFVKAFLEGGASAYVAPEWPDGDDVPLVMHMLFHRLIKAGNELADAWRHTTKRLEAAEEFRLFENAGR